MIEAVLDLVGLLPQPPALFDRWYVPRRRVSLLGNGGRLSPSPGGARQLLVDVSVIRSRDAKTGIQRVVHEVLERLRVAPPPGYTVKTVAATAQTRYRYVDWPAVSSTPWQGEVIASAGDIFLALDLAPRMVTRHRRQLAQWKMRGARLHFLVHDLIAVRHPEWFSRKLTVAIARWLRQVAILADGILCISEATRRDLTDWFQDHYGLPPDAVRSRKITLGWDIPADPLPASNSAPAATRPTSCEAREILMVGTLEPRKGHAQVLDAFETIWDRGAAHRLIIVGRPGWQVQKFLDRLRQHREMGRRLVWLDDADDPTLVARYNSCDGVIVASFAEGFGLPLVEALGHEKPVLARDLPVFRENARADVTFFSANDGPALTPILIDWIAHLGDRENPAAERRCPPSWDDTVDAIRAELTEEQGRPDSTQKPARGQQV